jgi:hypothetical protein
MREIPDSVRALQRDLMAIFGGRLQSLIVYGTNEVTPSPTSTMAIVRGLNGGDLGACADHLAGWHDSGLATPLLLGAHEFERSLDAFPFEFGAILANHALVFGVNPFDGLTVDRADLRRACEMRARSHLLHLREGYLETRGRGDAVAELIVRSAPALAALVTSVARLQGETASDPIAAARQLEATAQLTAGSLADVVTLTPASALSADLARRLFPPYLDAVARLTNDIDRWSVA